MIELFATVLAGALARRIAGGVVHIPGGSLVARAAASLGLAWVLCWLAPAAPVPQIAWIGGLFFLGMASGFPPGGMVPRTAEHVGGISQQHGWALIGPMALLAAVYGQPWWPLVVAAAAVGPIYWAATLWQPTVPWLGFNRDGLPDPPAWAEPWVGGVMGAGLFFSLRGC